MSKILGEWHRQTREVISCENVTVFIAHISYNKSNGWNKTVHWSTQSYVFLKLRGISNYGLCKPAFCYTMGAKEKEKEKERRRHTTKQSVCVLTQHVGHVWQWKGMFTTRRTRHAAFCFGQSGGFVFHKIKNTTETSALFASRAGDNERFAIFVTLDIWHLGGGGVTNQIFVQTHAAVTGRGVFLSIQPKMFGQNGTGSAFNGVTETFRGW